MNGIKNEIRILKFSMIIIFSNVFWQDRTQKSALSEWVMKFHDWSAEC